ncbi:MAG TPA: Crp/Fnr family transcriptional regulator [Lacibacter sp.]|nr:Crp/Fnr family transcriptional regulator [Lacibacter sp.]
MSFHKLESAVLKYGVFSREQLAAINASFSIEEVKKGQLLLKEGMVCRGIYFVNNGSFRHFEVTDEGEEHTMAFFTEGDWMLEPQSFTSQKPAVGTIEAAEPGEVMFLSVHALHTLLKTHDSFFQLARILELITVPAPYRSSRLSPEEKYEQLLLHRPLVIQKFSSRHIASYLGMAPETLSRVRRKLIS